MLAASRMNALPDVSEGADVFDGVLDLSSCDLGPGDIPKLAGPLARLTNLVTLNLEYNKIGPEGAKALAASAPRLGSLTTLNLRGNNIGRDGATALAGAAKHLRLLTTLDLSFNHIGPDGATALAGAAQHMRSLTTLNLNYNTIGPEGIPALADAARRLGSLTTLNLKGNNIGRRGASGLGAAAPCLGSLTTLDLSQNHIGSEGAKALAGAAGHLRSLRTLDLSQNHIRSEGVKALAGVARHLRSLRTLDLSVNTVGSEGARALASEAPHLRLLTKLGLCNSAIANDGLPPLLAAILTEPWRTSLEELDLKGNPLDVPPERLESSDAAGWRAYAEQLDLEDKQPLHEVKLLLLGHGRQGKTHLLHRLFRSDPFYYKAGQDPTHDIDCELWKITVPIDGKPAEFTVRAWDFGGQPQLHGSHRFFLSDKRGLFVIVCDASKKRGPNALDYWLRFVRHESVSLIDAASTPGPVIVATTKWDILPDVAEERKDWLGLLNGEQLRIGAGFPVGASVTVVDELGWSDPPSDKSKAERIRSRHQRALERLKDAIQNAASLIPDLKVRYLPSMIRAIRWLESEAFNDGESPARGYIERAAFIAACERVGLRSELREEALEIAHNIGVVHYLGHRPEFVEGHRLRNLIFNPSWVKTPVIKLVRAKERSIKGVIAWADIADVLPLHEGNPASKVLWERLPFSAEDRLLVLDLMEACRLIYRVQLSQGAFPAYFVPDHLPESRGIAEPPKGDRVWYRRFSWLPDWMFGQLIGELHSLAVDGREVIIARDELTFTHKKGSQVTIRWCVPPADSVDDSRSAEGTNVYIAVSGGNAADAERIRDLIAEKLCTIRNEQPLGLGDWEEVSSPPGSVGVEVVGRAVVNSPVVSPDRIAVGDDIDDDPGLRNLSPVDRSRFGVAEGCISEHLGVRWTPILRKALIDTFVKSKSPDGLPAKATGLRLYYRLIRSLYISLGKADAPGPDWVEHVLTNADPRVAQQLRAEFQEGSLAGRPQMRKKSTPKKKTDKVGRAWDEYRECETVRPSRGSDEKDAPTELQIRTIKRQYEKALKVTQKNQRKPQ